MKKKHNVKANKNYQRIVIPRFKSNWSCNRHRFQQKCTCICTIPKHFVLIKKRLLDVCVCDFTSSDSLSVAPISSGPFERQPTNISTKPEKKRKPITNKVARVWVLRWYNKCYFFSVVCNIANERIQRIVFHSFGARTSCEAI